MSDRARASRRRGDGQDIRQRLARVAAAAEQAPRPAPERATAVLEERARALARAPATPPARGETLEVVTFALADERYALEARHVREVLRLPDCTPVPGAPDFVVGLTNVRGEILAVFDLRRLLGLPQPAPAAEARLLVLGDGRAEFGVPADAAGEVRTLRAGDLRDVPGTPAGRDYLRGVTAEGLVLLDGAALLRDQRLFIDQGEDPAH